MILIHIGGKKLNATSSKIKKEKKRISNVNID
jgi:hypothetical protein